MDLALRMAADGYLLPAAGTLLELLASCGFLFTDIFATGKAWPRLTLPLLLRALKTWQGPLFTVMVFYILHI